MRRSAQISGGQGTLGRPSRAAAGRAPDRAHPRALRSSSHGQEASRWPAQHGEDRCRASHAVFAGIAATILATPSFALAQAPVPAKNLDLFQGPVLAPLRVIGLGGSFAAYAEGVDAIAANAAAAALREPYSVKCFDYDLSLSLPFPATFRGTDFDNDGKVGFSYDQFVFSTIGASVQAG